MSTGLISIDGMILWTNGGISADPDCCCTGPPPPPACPFCCVEVDWGTFDEAGDLIGSEAVSGGTVDIKLTMPTKFSRIVCDGSAVTVAFGVPSPGAEAEGGHIVFGAAWGASGASPAADKVFDRGLVDWVDDTARTFSAVLTLSKCWLDTEDFLAYITIGLDDPAWSFEIDITRCTTPIRCCDGPDCDPCCWEVLPIGPSPIYYDGKVWMVSESTGGYRLLISIDTDGAAGLYCAAEGVVVQLQIIPPRWDPAKTYEATVTFGDPWTLGSNSPAFNPVDGAVDSNTPPSGGGSVDFGTKSETEYSVTLASDCADIYCGTYILGQISASVSITESESVSGTFGFTPCEEDNEDCCCAPSCRCDCYWPLSKSFCDDALVDEQFGSLYELGGPTRLVDFKITITASSPVFCGGTTDTAEIIQFSEESRHYGICTMVGTIMCARDNGLVITVEDTTQTCIPQNPPAGRVSVNLGTSDCDPNISVAIDFAMPDGPFSAETIPGAVLTDCNTIGGSGSRVQGGVTYNWTFEGTVEGGRPCPCEETP